MVQELHPRVTDFNIPYIPIQLIHTKMEEFTPEKLVSTFDYDLVRGWIKDIETFVLTEEAAKALETKLESPHLRRHSQEVDKTIDRISRDAKKPLFCLGGLKFIYPKFKKEKPVSKNVVLDIETTGWSTNPQQQPIDGGQKLIQLRKFVDKNK